MEKPYKNGWFGGTIIFGNIHVILPSWETIVRVGRIAVWIKDARDIHGSSLTSKKVRKLGERTKGCGINWQKLLGSFSVMYPHLHIYIYIIWLSKYVIHIYVHWYVHISHTYYVVYACCKSVQNAYSIYISIYMYFWVFRRKRGVLYMWQM